MSEELSSDERENGSVDSGSSADYYEELSSDESVGEYRGEELASLDEEKIGLKAELERVHKEVEE